MYEILQVSGEAVRIQDLFLAITFVLLEQLLRVEESARLLRATPE